MKHDFEILFILLSFLFPIVSCHKADNEIPSHGKFNEMSNKQLQRQLDYLITHRGVQQQERLVLEDYY